MKLISIAGTTAAANDALAANWQVSRAADYTAWQTDKAARTPTAFTDNWLTDRATLRQAIVARKEKDGDGLAYSRAFPTDRAYDLRWTDATGADQILVGENTARQGGVLQPVAAQMLAFGGSGADSFTGYDNARGDHLYGGAGNDRMGRQTNGGPVFAANAGEGITRTEPFDIKNVASCRSTAMAGKRFDATPANNAHRRSATWVA